MRSEGELEMLKDPTKTRSESEDTSCDVPLMELDHDLDTGHARGRTTRPSRTHRLTRSPMWLISTIVLSIILVIQNILHSTTSTYETGYKTDLAVLNPSLKIHEVRFSGAIRNMKNGSMHVPELAVDSQGRRFTGPPSAEVDAAWHDLVYGRYVRFTDSEVDWLNTDSGVPALIPFHTNDTSMIPADGYYGGPDMLHSLHCLNGFRKHIHYTLYDEVTPMKGMPLGYEAMHLEHCVEQLRQAVLCHGDTTPVTLKPVYGGDGKLISLLGETERTHTCRDGIAVARAWQEEAKRGARGFVNAE